MEPKDTPQSLEDPCCVIRSSLAFLLLDIGGTIASISMIHTKEMILKHFLFKNFKLKSPFPMMQSRAKQPTKRMDGLFLIINHYN